MATASISPVTRATPDNNVLTLELFIAAPRERIFQALTDPKQAARWWGRKDEYYFNRFTTDMRVGGKWSMQGSSVKRGDLEVHGEFLELDPPNRLAYTWISSWLPVPTRVVWDLEPRDKGTLLKLTHCGFAGNAEMVQGHSHGWTLVLTWLQAFAEKGETGDVSS